MAITWYQLTIYDQDYDSTIYTTWVQADSQKAAIAQGSALIGAEKAIREHNRMGRPPHTSEAVLTMPEIKLEKVGMDDAWDKVNKVEVRVPGK